MTELGSAPAAEPAPARHRPVSVPARGWPWTVIRRPLPALIVAAALWGGSLSGTKYALTGFDPMTLLTVELVFATVALWAGLLIRGYRPPTSWRLAAVLGLLEPALAYLGETIGLSRTDALNGSPVCGLESALVVVLATCLLREAITRTAVLALGVALAGLAVLAGTGGPQAAIGICASPEGCSARACTASSPSASTTEPTLCR